MVLEDKEASWTGEEEASGKSRGKGKMVEGVVLVIGQVGGCPVVLERMDDTMI